MSFLKTKTDEGHRYSEYLKAHYTQEATWLNLPGSYGQRQAGLHTFNNTPTTIDHFGTGGLGPTNDPIQSQHVPVGSANAYPTNMFDSDKTETSELGQGSINPTWTDSTVPDNSDGNNSVPSITPTSAAPGSSRECSCILCFDLGSQREASWSKTPVNYPCRLSDCNFSTAVGSQQGEYPGGCYAERAARGHELNHIRHNRQWRCVEDRCVYDTKRWSDFKRHYTSKHCLNPKTKFPCPEIDCKYGGNNGFTRKDKLKSHREKVHEKHARPEKRFRVSKSNAQGAA